MYQRVHPTESLYIHWPFCPYKCHFCPFVALASHDHFMPEYHAALKAEIVAFTAESRETIRTIYFGGGTPSTYPEDLLLDMSGILEKSFALVPDVEVTLEVNPGTVTREKLLAWQKAGINRLSVGVQSLNDQVLKNLNRHQAARDVYQFLELAAPLFENISVDLILGLPGIADAEWQRYLTEIVQWPIKHLSMYFLTVHENTPLYFGVQQKKFDLPADERVVQLYEWSVKEVEKYGFEQYEISNFARPGFRSRHNSVYWQRKPYKGFGLGACSFDGSNRFQNEKNLLTYLKKAQSGNDLGISAETLSTEQVMLEELMLGMRQREGYNLMRLVLPEKRAALSLELAALEQAGYLQVQGEIIFMTPLGLAVENEMVVRLARLCE